MFEYPFFADEIAHERHAQFMREACVWRRLSRKLGSKRTRQPIRLESENRMRIIQLYAAVR